MKKDQETIGNSQNNQSVYFFTQESKTNAKIKAEQIFKDLCKIITAPCGQDARVSDIDKIVAKNY
jgi:hypothetical protein